MRDLKYLWSGSTKKEIVIETMSFGNLDEYTKCSLVYLLYTLDVPAPPCVASVACVCCSPGKARTERDHCVILYFAH